MGGIASLGVHPSSSVKHKFQEPRNANGSDSVTRNYPEVCQKVHRSVMGHNSIPPSRISSRDPEENVGTNEVPCEVWAEFEIKAE